MITVAQAESMIQSLAKDFGDESISFETANGRVLAEDILADRDLPPFNRVAMDGIAIRFTAFEKGLRTFQVKAIQAAGVAPIEIADETECIEIMTGAALPASTDTVIRYEDLERSGDKVTVITENILKGQSVHQRGSDKKKQQVIVQRHQLVTPPVISVAASVGKSFLLVKKLPSVLIISTGNELVEVADDPADFEIRRSNNYLISEVLKTFSVKPVMVHLTDDFEQTALALKKFLAQYDVILLSGGISMGKFDHVPAALESNGVKKMFHKVRQRPGKPFWFGNYNGRCLVFAFPGNPVSTFMCLQRYFLPWLKSSLGLSAQQAFAILSEPVTFDAPLQYFLQVKLKGDQTGRLIASPVAGNGSGDFANLTATDAFLELPMERNVFEKGEAFRVWPFAAGF